MDSVALWLLESGRDERIERKILRDQSNILGLSDKSFVQNFRLSKESFLYVLNEISPELKENRRSTGISQMCKLAAALKFLGQGGYQHQIGSDQHVGLAQQSMSSCLNEVCQSIEKVLCPKHITFKMTVQEEREAKRYFYQTFGIPGIIGAIDGTHIQMVRPVVNEHLYFNRKLKHSINAMVICDHKMNVRAIDTRFGGASHDSHMWNVSYERRELKHRFECGDKTTRLLGDSGYPLEAWLLTPYRCANEGTAEAKYNEIHSQARSMIERLFGVLKGRFRCLLAARELHYSPKKVSTITNVCCALHNICNLYNVEEPIIIENDSESSLPMIASISDDITTTQASFARNMRDEIKNSLT